MRPRALERRLDDGGQNEKEKDGAGLRSENRPHCAFAFQGMFGRDFTPHSAVEGAARLRWKLYHLLLATLPTRTVVTFSLFCQHRYAGFSVAPLNQIGLFFLFFGRHLDVTAQVARGHKHLFACCFAFNHIRVVPRGAGLSRS